MWEAIRANRTRSALLLAAMALVLVTLGAGAGMVVGARLGAGVWLNSEGIAVSNDALAGGALGVALALLIWFSSWIYSRADGDGLILRSVRARRIDKQDHPRLFNVVEEMSIASGLGSMPKVHVFDDSSPNAFAVGRDSAHGSVVFSSGLLRLLNRDELQGVAAHEIGHIRNEDIRFMTHAAVLVGGVELLSRLLLHGAALGDGRSSGASRRASGKGSNLGPLVAVLFMLAILSPLIIRLLYYACSRTREYLADASAARFTRYPEGLASALEKITAHHAGGYYGEVNGALAPLYIVNPLAGLSGIGATHPPTDSRVKILRSMGGGASYVDYQAAIKRVAGERLHLPALEAAARSGERLGARPPTADDETGEEAATRARQALDLVDRFAGFIPIACACGLRVKLPPDYEQDRVNCPRCDRILALPSAEADGPETAETVAAEVELPQAARSGESLHFTRQDGQWEAFRCSCGQVIHLGPGYPLNYTVCAGCNQRIAIQGGSSS